MAKTHETIEIDGEQIRIVLTWSRSRPSVLTGIELTTLPGIDGRRAEITTVLWRKIPIGRLIASNRPQPEPIEVPGSRVGRPRTRDAEHYRAVAEAYRAAIEGGQPPVKAVADAFDKTPSTARRWVHVARHRYGLLPPVRRGQAG